MRGLVAEFRRRSLIVAKKVLAPVLYRHLPIGLGPPQLYLYLDSVEVTRDVPGSVVEIGCDLCGTSILVAKFMQRTGIAKDYVAIDTFGGFVPGQFATDATGGTPVSHAHSFAAKDQALVRRILAMHRAGHVRLLQGDIVEMDPKRLPAPISVCLIDVDLYAPVLAGLNNAFPRMSPGGIMLVDDCHERSKWRARHAYDDFVAEHDLPHEVRYRMGVVRIPVTRP